MALGLLLLAAAAYSRTLVPIGDASRWISDRDYPGDAIVDGSSGIVGFAVSIDRRGRPTACRIERSSGARLLDETTCTLLMRRARFRPALDRAGRPVAAVYRQEVRWHLPGSAPDPIADQSFVAHSLITPAGTVARCSMSGPGAAGYASLGGCGAFGDPRFLRHFLGADYPRARSVDVRLIATAGDPPRRPAGMGAYRVLGVARAMIGPEGRITGCRSLQRVDAGRNGSTNLCDLLRANPPQFAAGRRRTITYTLDLSARMR